MQTMHIYITVVNFIMQIKMQKRRSQKNGSANCKDTVQSIQDDASQFETDPRALRILFANGFSNSVEEMGLQKWNASVDIY